MINAGELRKGKLLKLSGKLYVVVDHQHVKPGKGGAFVRTKLRSLERNATIDKTFRVDEKLEDAHVSRKPFQYLYEDKDDLVFMDLESYEQEKVLRSLVADGINFLEDGMEVEADVYEGGIIAIVLPIFVVSKVVQTETALKGDTVGGTTKPASIKTGYTLRVPLFVNEGDMLKIDTRTGEYITRVSSKMN